MKFQANYTHKMWKNIFFIYDTHHHQSLRNYCKLINYNYMLIASLLFK